MVWHLQLLATPRHQHYMHAIGIQANVGTHAINIPLWQMSLAFNSLNAWRLEQQYIDSTLHPHSPYHVTVT